ncbi:hypothetical protein OG709_30030 [Streptomyces sp. NBC_01267]|uniref:hypothetical protein n=1 Tax=Streptomyces sp. NBC_01267 TaxID=2903805 RepID=UPI002E362493|nr:hypothetical protein [Streptomyces sp. NBC_01267]
MALYDVTRNDEVQPGEFVSAFVIAAGTARARKAVAHMGGVRADGSNVTATVRSTAERPAVLSVYWDEREEEPTPIPDYF